MKIKTIEEGTLTYFVCVNYCHNSSSCCSSLFLGLCTCSRNRNHWYLCVLVLRVVCDFLKNMFNCWKLILKSEVQYFLFIIISSTLWLAEYSSWIRGQWQITLSAAYIYFLIKYIFMCKVGEKRTKVNALHWLPLVL